MRYTNLMVFAAAAFLSACDGDNDDDSNSTPTPTVTVTPTPTPTDSGVVLEVDPGLFLTGENVEISVVDCTLSNGSETQCYQIVSNHVAVEHEMGPFCPETIFDGEDAGGLWIDGVDQTYAVDGAFIENLATFYNDDNWQMFDEAGNVFRIETAEACAQGADPNVEDEFVNVCLQCLAEWVDFQETYLIPVTPQIQDTSTLLLDGPGTEEPGIEYGPLVRGLAFNGVRFDHPAGLDVILDSYGLAPIDVSGGHVNNALGYHYHGHTGAITQVEQSDGHAPMIGYALDGHGIYAELNAEGEEPGELDECRGQYDDVRGYHYHVLPVAANEFFDCFYGAWAEEEDDAAGGGPPPQ